MPDAPIIEENGRFTQIGDYYRDLVNKDLLKVLGFSDDAIDDTKPDQLTRFVKMAVFVCGVTYLGPQEMKLSQLSKVERYQKVTGWRLWRLKFRHRKMRIETE